MPCLSKSRPSRIRPNLLCGPDGGNPSRLPQIPSENQVLSDPFTIDNYPEPWASLVMKRYSVLARADKWVAHTHPPSLSNHLHWPSSTTLYTFQHGAGVCDGEGNGRAEPLRQWTQCASLTASIAVLDVLPETLFDIFNVL